MGYETSREEVRSEFEMGIRRRPVEGQSNEKQPFSEQDKTLFLSAWSNFEKGENGKQACNSCGTSIVFEKRGSVVSHRCSCGKFSGALRGL